MVKHFLIVSAAGVVAVWSGQGEEGLTRQRSLSANPVVETTIERTHTDSSQRAFDSLVLGMIGPSITDGLDTTTSPCDDLFQFVNGGWRNRAVLPDTQDQKHQMVTVFQYAYTRMLRQLDTLLDAAREGYATTHDPTLRALGTFYESCMVADSLEYNYRRQWVPKDSQPDSTRIDQCRQRTLSYLGAAAGQAFAEDLKRSGAIERMEQLLVALRSAVQERLEQHPLMSDDEKSYALNRLRKLILRVGIPDELVDYSTLVLSPKDYHGNTRAIGGFRSTQWAVSIGDRIREKWKASLLTPNAFYMPQDHAIEIPTLMFTPPFFFRAGEDLLNFAGVGYIIGHEIFHSLAPQLPQIENPRMQVEIDSFKAFNTSLGMLDDWKANGKASFNEDIADLGGSRVAYQAWKETLRNRPQYKAEAIDGYTPDQRFYIALGRIWRSKWTKKGVRSSGHAPHFARVNAVAMQSPGFQTAFGCKEGDKMFVPDDKMARIW